MLKYLHIENIAVIEQSNIEFFEGFNVLTGETGAGKSIIIDSIYAVLGHRTSKELIRNGCDKAKVSAVFSSLSNTVREKLSDIGINADDEGNYVIERTLSLTGNGYIRVNGVPVSASVLRDVSPLLINIHGQHDNQSLLQPQNHYIYLDKIAGNDTLTQDYSTQFKRFNSIRSQLKALEMDEDEKLRRIDILKYQINELESSNLKIGEMGELKEKVAIARNIGKKVKTLKNILSLLKENEDGNSTVDLLRSAMHIISVDKEQKLDKELDNLQDAYNSIENVIESLEGTVSSYESDEYDIDKIEDRLAYLSSLSAKYGKDEEEMTEFLNNAKSELETILFNDEEVEKLGDELISAQDALIECAKKLTHSRLCAADKFEKSVKFVLSELNMPSVDISVEHKTGRYTKNGCDEIQFLFSANAGENKKPLAKIASGGELSRVMLAIKSVLSEKDDVDTLIFDEIDSGISGITADKVGNQLGRVADTHQVICVTHLAQIASVASNHFLISKDVRDGRTYTEVARLEGNDRVKEIARIMSGSKISDSVLKSAEELITKNIPLP